jgi:hypothetical protein
MAAKRLLIISNELIANRPDAVPEVVWKQVRAADEVRVVVPALTGRLQSWLSDIDGAVLDADTRMQELVGDISSVHPSDEANWRERRLGEKVRARSDLPVTEMILDRDGRVLSVTTE